MWQVIVEVMKLAVDVSKRTAQIRTAVYGKDVRENLAGGIEDIANDVNKFEESIDKNQEDFKNKIVNEQNKYEAKVNNEWSDYKEIMDQDELTRKNNEDTRISNEATRQGNEGLRQDMYTEFRGYTNELATVGKISYEIDGGWIGDEDDGTGLNIDGGTL